MRRIILILRSFSRSDSDMYGVKSKPRYLTKSAFRTATECPTKLSYLKKPEYFSTKQDNDFLRALADGGFQVGELAKIYHPNGTLVDTLDYVEALKRTDELLRRENAIIYEAAFRYENCFIRADVVVKKGNLVRLIEVKAKSHDGTGKDPFWTKKRDRLDSGWEPYLLDVAFQKWVVSKARSELIVTPYLMLADKTSKASVDGINQRFLVISSPTDTNVRVRVAPNTTQEVLGNKLLAEICVESEVDHVLSQDYDGRTFEEYVRFLSEHYVSDSRLSPELSRECRGCEYRISSEKEAEGFKSGFKRCWTESGSLVPGDFARPNVLDIWKLHFTKKDAFLRDRRYFMDQLNPADIEPKTKKKEADVEPGLSNTERQWLQISLAGKSNAEPFIDVKGLSEAFQEYDPPYHFIDFETTRAAIPFHQGRAPYEQVAFQFSHHVVYVDGRVEHKGEHLCFERGKFPNYDFVRALKASLQGDNGTIFRYADHENTVLREIRAQLRSDLAPPSDAEDLCDWIDTVTREKTDDGTFREGSRCMVDLRWLVQKFYYHPATNGSNSIKAVLPAILSHSRYLQEKYSKPIYGTPDGIPSRNFKNHAWIELKNGKVQDPYKTLQPIFTDVELPQGSPYEEDDRIAEGGAAMTAYGRMQFTEMSDAERERVASALKRYCELDTFAMVLIYEYWNHEIRTQKAKRAA